jgi:hypothetical protein
MKLPAFTSFLNNLYKVDNNILFEVIKEGFLCIFENAFHYTPEESAVFTQRVMEKYAPQYKIEDIELCDKSSVCFNINGYGRYKISFNRLDPLYIKMNFTSETEKEQLGSVEREGQREIKSMMDNIFKNNINIINEEHLSKTLKLVFQFLAHAIEEIKSAEELEKKRSQPVEEETTIQEETVPEEANIQEEVLV